MLQNGVLRYPAPPGYRLLPPLRATSPGEGGFGACTSHSLTGKARKASPSPRQPPRQGQKKRPRRSGEAFLRCRRDHSALGAPTGHTPAHAPHSMQVSASMTYLPSPSEIALTGHSAAQAPQAMHSSEILYAMVKYTSLLVCLYCNSFGGKKQGLFLKKNQIRGFFCRSRPHSAEKIFSESFFGCCARFVSGGEAVDSFGSTETGRLGKGSALSTPATPLKRGRS